MSARAGLTLKLGSMFTLGAMDGLRVSELAERAGVAPSTVRFYERARLLSPPRRAATPGLLDALFRASAPVSHE